MRRTLLLTEIIDCIVADRIHRAGLPVSAKPQSHDSRTTDGSDDARYVDRGKTKKCTQCNSRPRFRSISRDLSACSPRRTFDDTGDAKENLL